MLSDHPLGVVPPHGFLLKWRLGPKGGGGGGDWGRTQRALVDGCHLLRRLSAPLQFPLHYCLAVHDNLTV